MATRSRPLKSPPGRSQELKDARKPLFKLVYKHAGIAQSVRMACHIGDVPYEDACVDAETWAKLRNPSGPVMVCEGRRVRHHQTILRFVGKLANMYPANPIDSLLVDDLLDKMREMRIKLASQKVEGDVAERQRRVFDSGVLHDFLAELEYRVTTNGTGYFCGDKLSIADLELCTLANWITRGTLEGIPPEILGEFPGLIEVQKIVHAYESHEKARLNKRMASQASGRQHADEW
eukprot:GEMP01031654.1.p1 GENE.GEMP01031654.1~~GEMP01031654.1.p1  ORF type:complete len:234 (+),score=47.59 GEMP01031654.1:100-801(+)